MSIQQICENYTSMIRYIDDVEIPAIKTKIAQLETLLASLRAEGLQDSELQPVLSALDQANQGLVDANAQRDAFSQEYDILGCGYGGPLKTGIPGA